MALTAEQKTEIIVGSIVTHFPSLPSDDIDGLVAWIISDFYDDYSPDPSEQVSSFAAGSGVTLREYSIYMAYSLWDLFPVKIEEEDFGDILRRVLTI